MAKALQRILRLRQLAEEQARQEVERAAQRVRQVTAACACQLSLEREQRSALAESWKCDRPEETANLVHANLLEDGGERKGWLMEEAVLEFFGWRRMRLEKLRVEEMSRMEPLVAVYTECRRELRQTEQLVEQRAAMEAVEKNRRAQAASDEWFSQRSRTQQRREVSRPEIPSSHALKDKLRGNANEGDLRQF